jgi:polysaccharide export outer membrane protein
MRKSFFKRFQLLIPILLSLIIVSCASRKGIKYFRDIPDSGAVKTLSEADFVVPKIQQSDILTIIIQTVDPTATQAINADNIPTAATGLSASSTQTTGSPQVPVAGYLVNKDGDVELPVIGKVHVEGLTTDEAREFIRTKSEKLLISPTVIVRYANFTVTVTGEVSKPSVYVIPNEKVTVLDALAMAGDLTIFGKRDNILLLRENLDGTRTAYRINLNKSNVLNQPYYYLHQNDYIYVEPNEAKAASTDVAQAKFYSIVGTVLALLIVIAARVK